MLVGYILGMILGNYKKKLDENILGKIIEAISCGSWLQNGTLR